MGNHSQIGASSMHRWSKCPGSVRLSRDIPPRTSHYAEEGTRAHEIAAGLLNSKPCTLNGHAEVEMLEAVEVYVSLIQEDRKEASICLIEHSFDLSKNVHPGMFGTADAVLYFPKEKLLRVYDYKHGAGISVDVENNDQLKYYALGALLSVPDCPSKEIELVIVQPRCPHPDGIIRRWRFETLAILDFAADLVDFAKKTEDPFAPLVPGDHCRFCPASGICPELNNKAVALAKSEFSQLAPQQNPYDPKKLSEVLSWLPVMEAWIKNVRDFAYAEAEHGRLPPGWKLVAKRATRKWKEEEQKVVQMLFDEYLLTQGELYDRSLKSVAQIEKIIPKNDKSKSRFESFYVKESSGTTLVSEDDPRPAVDRSPRSEFKQIEMEELFS